jgi:hypothetical protein
VLRRKRWDVGAPFLEQKEVISAYLNLLDV